MDSYLLQHTPKSTLRYSSVVGSVIIIVPTPSYYIVFRNEGTSTYVRIPPDELVLAQGKSGDTMAHNFTIISLLNFATRCAHYFARPSCIIVIYSWRAAGYVAPVYVAGRSC